MFLKRRHLVVGILSGAGGLILWGLSPPKIIPFERDLKKSDLVILGSGWGAVGILKSIDTKCYNVTVISPTNYFLFTPLLPGTTVGTHEPRSVATPVREICANVGARFLNAKAKDVVLDENRVICYDQDGGKFEVNYDQLVIAVGAANNTFDTPGVDENCCFLKSVDDAIVIRKKIMYSLEKASLPNVDPDTRKKLLSFVVVGGGPTGVEFAGELRDFIEQDLWKLFPNICKSEVKITLLQSGDHILNTFDKKISEFAEKNFSDRGIDILLHCRVKSVNKDEIEYFDQKSQETKFIKHGLVVWSTGIAPNEFTKNLTKQIWLQNHKKSIITDSHLQVIGTKSSVFAIGDCSSMKTDKTLDKLQTLFAQADQDNSNGLSKQELTNLFERMSKEYPQGEFHLRNVQKLFQKFDKNHDGILSLDEFKNLLSEVDKSIKTLPATAQVASQQGYYLGRILSQMYQTKGKSWNSSDLETLNSPFLYRHMGSMANIGGEQAVVDFDNGWIGEGNMSFWLWKSVYLSKQVSLKTRILLASDWLKLWVFGRDITKF